MISLTKVSKRFGEREVLRNIDLDVARGEVLAIIGPTGVVIGGVFTVASRVISGRVRRSSG